MTTAAGITKFAKSLGGIVCFALVASWPAAAADKTHPDWPCLQKKVENFAASQVWDGPPIDELEGWRDDKPISDLVKTLVSRRTTIPDALEGAKTFAQAQPEAERNKRVTLLFAGVFQTLTNERRIIMGGIEKYNRRQKARAAIIEEKGKAIEELETKAGTDEASAQQLAKVQEDYDWETRIFKERNDNLPIACELPVLIDQRLFELGRAIRGLMKA